jgi:nucleoside-diphosphate-sugar epimerase
LVTGASGFIGRPLIAALKGHGVEVIGASRTAPTGDLGAVDWIETDLLVDDPVRLVSTARADTLIHLAWIATPGVYPHSPANAHWLAGSIALAKAFLAAGGKRIVAVGSCLEYDVDQTGPRTLYAAAKHACHVGLRREVAAIPSATFAWARVFFLLGALDHPDRFAPSLARNLVAGAPARMSSGMVERDFIDVRDCAQALCALSQCRASGAFDIATGRGWRLRDLAEVLGRASGRPDLLSIDASLDRPDEPARLIGDPSALGRSTRFTPAYSTEQSVTDILDYWRGRTSS